MSTVNYNRYSAKQNAAGLYEVKRMKRNFFRDGVAGVVLQNYWFTPDYAATRFVGDAMQCAQWVEQNGGTLELH